MIPISSAFIRVSEPARFGRVLQADRIPLASNKSEVSRGSIIFESGPAINVRQDGNLLSCVDEKAQLELQLSPDKPLVIGRAEGAVPYLAQGLVSTKHIPGSARPISPDSYVSRAHLQILGSSDGIIVVDGVPSRSGRIRASKNGTSVDGQKLVPGQPYLIPKGQSRKITLAGSTVIRIIANEDDAI